MLGHALVALGVAALTGVVLGVLWKVLTPSSQVIVGLIVSPADQVPFGAEGIFTVLMVFAGVISAVVARGWLRDAGPLAVLAVVVAGVVGSVVAWRVGAWAGPSAIPADLAAGTVVTAPLRLRSHGLLMAWSIAAVFVLLWIAALSAAPTADAASIRSAPPTDGDAARPLAGPTGTTSEPTS